jgi:hypothetical protein
VIYNVDPGQLEAALGELFEQLGRPVERRGNLWVGGVPLFELEPFVGGRTVTFRWLTDDLQMFQEAERYIREGVGSLPTGDNPAARWLMTSAIGCILLVVFFVVVLLILFRKI